MSSKKKVHSDYFYLRRIVLLVVLACSAVMGLALTYELVLGEPGALMTYRGVNQVTLSRFSWSGQPRLIPFVSAWAWPLFLAAVGWFYLPGVKNYEKYATLQLELVYRLAAVAGGVGFVVGLVTAWIDLGFKKAGYYIGDTKMVAAVTFHVDSSLLTGVILSVIASVFMIVVREDFERSPSTSSRHDGRVMFYSFLFTWSLTLGLIQGILAAAVVFFSGLATNLLVFATVKLIKWLFPPQYAEVE